MSDEEPNPENAGRLIADGIAKLIALPSHEKAYDAAQAALARGLKMALELLTKERR